MDKINYSLWLKAQFEAHPSLSKAELAKALKLEPPAISKILNGSRQVKADEYATMRRYFGLPVDGQAATAGGQAAYILDPLHNTQSLQDDNGDAAPQWHIPAEIISKRTQATPDKIRVFTIEDNLMEPNFRRDEPVLVDLSQTTPSPPGTFIVSDGFGYMARNCEFLPNSTPPEIKLSASDTSFQPQTLKADDFRIIGRVIAKLQWI